jgi:hypothetical protein
MIDDTSTSVVLLGSILMITFKFNNAIKNTKLPILLVRYTPFYFFI